jgi:hypothetical protein
MIIKLNKSLVTTETLTAADVFDLKPMECDKIQLCRVLPKAYYVRISNPIKTMCDANGEQWVPMRKNQNKGVKIPVLNFQGEEKFLP